MSGLTVKGKIVGRIIKNIKPKQGQPFDVATYYIVGGDGRKPIELRSYNTGRKTGQEVECPVYIKMWRGEKSSGVNIVEIDEKR